MRILFIGGTGNISTDCTLEALGKGHEVVHLNRGRSIRTAPAGVETIEADAKDRATVEAALGKRTFDVVTDWIAFTVEDIERDISLFRDRTAQYVFISSASAYQKPPSHYLITESTPLFNPYWLYSRNKIACERRLEREHAENRFPFTVVRPSHTYSTGWLPTTFGSSDWTVPARILDGRSIVVHGDGSSLWTLTHTSDFAKGFTGLLGDPRTLGETFHITSDEALTWDQIHTAIAAGLGKEARIVHVSSETIARHSERYGPGLIGDKAHSVVFDNSKIKRFVPGYQAVIPFHEGVRKSLAWLEEHPERKTIDGETDKLIDDLVKRYSSAG